MTHLLVHNKVEDYQNWRIAFDDMKKTRQSMGETGFRVYRTISNPNELVVITDWPSAEKARAYSQLPELRQAMQKGGVISQPEILILEEV